MGALQKVSERTYNSIFTIQQMRQIAQVHNYFYTNLRKYLRGKLMQIVCALYKYIPCLLTMILVFFFNSYMNLIMYKMDFLNSGNWFTSRRFWGFCLFLEQSGISSEERSKSVSVTDHRLLSTLYQLIDTPCDYLMMQTTKNVLSFEQLYIVRTLVFVNQSTVFL